MGDRIQFNSLLPFVKDLVEYYLRIDHRRERFSREIKKERKKKKTATQQAPLT